MCYLEIIDKKWSVAFYTGGVMTSDVTSRVSWRAVVSSVVSVAGASVSCVSVVAERRISEMLVATV